LIDSHANGRCVCVFQCTFGAQQLQQYCEASQAMACVTDVAVWLHRGRSDWVNHRVSLPTAGTVHPTTVWISCPLLWL